MSASSSPLSSMVSLAVMPDRSPARKVYSRLPSDVGADRERAPRSELAEEGPLDEHRVARGLVIDRSDGVAHAAITLAALDGDAPLTDRRDELGRIEHLGDAVGQPSTSSAATAITIAPPAGSFSSRVWMLPRSSSNTRSRRARWSWARRRTDPVAIVAPNGSSPSRASDQRVGGRAPLP
jgi:hypothetical protein